MFRTYKPIRPTSRHRRVLIASTGLFKKSRAFFFIKKRSINTFSGKKKNSGYRILQQRYNFKNFMMRPTKTPFVVRFISFFRFPSRDLLMSVNIFGALAVYNQAELSFAGTIISPQTPGLKKLQTNQFIKLRDIPINLPVSNIFNKANTKTTFARSSGQQGFKKKIEKKNKLLCVSLPSTNLMYLPSQTWCVLGFSSNLLLNTIYHGMWGSSATWKKKLVVRGVAKNPVDHPNGGRTKSKQPELSPWGWIAKHSKIVPFKF